MKQLWLSLGLLAALAAFCFSLVGVMQARNSETLALLAQAQTAGADRDAEAALQCSRAARDQWEKNAGLIDALMNHEETDEIHREFSDLLCYAESDRREDFLLTCARLIVMVEHLNEMERPLWRNVL